MRDVRDRSQARRRRVASAAIAGGIVAALAMFGMAATLSVEERAEDVAGPALVVATERAHASPSYVVTRSFVGRVEASRESDVGFELAGRLARVRADEGDRVSRGEALAELDTARLEARRAELLAARSQAAASADLATSTLVRVEEAHALDAVSSQDLDAADRDAASRRAALARVEAQIAAVDVDLDKSVLRAPFDAIVVARRADEGRVLAAGHAVFHLLERARPEARIGLAAGVDRALVAGDRHPVTVDGEEVDAVVKAVLPLRRDGSRSVDVVLTLEADLGAVRSGDLARLELRTPIHEPGFWLPLTALTESARGLWAVYVAEPAGPEGAGPDATHRLVRRELELLHEESERVYVRGTLRDGELVVSRGLHRLAPGLPVRVAPGAAS